MVGVGWIAGVGAVNPTEVGIGILVAAVGATAGAGEAGGADVAVGTAELEAME